MITQKEITLEKNTTGAWTASAIIGGYLVTRQFYFYTKREAARLFLLELNKKKEATK